MPTSSQIMITFPSSFTFSDTTACTITAIVPTGGMGTPSACSISSNTLTLTNPFGGSGTYSAGNTL